MTDAPKIDTQAPDRIWMGCADSDGHHAVWFEDDEGGTEYILASLSAAREAAAAQAMREAAAYLCDRMETRTNRPARCAKLIREIPLPDTTALDRLIAERVREAFEKLAQEIEADEREAATWGGPDPRGPHEAQINLRFARMLRARGSKEGRDG